MVGPITVGGEPEESRDEPAAQPALERCSVREYQLAERERIAAAPPVHVWLREVERRVAAAGSSIPRSFILEAQDADRR